MDEGQWHCSLRQSLSMKVMLYTPDIVIAVEVGTIPHGMLVQFRYGLSHIERSSSW
jgi:hypothetical protein